MDPRYGDEESWHVTQEVCIVPWFIFSTVKDVVLLWHSEHSFPGIPVGVVVGIWLEGFAVTPT